MKGINSNNLNKLLVDGKKMRFFGWRAIVKELVINPVGNDDLCTTILSVNKISSRTTCLPTRIPLVIQDE
jgi:hypothetical protein